MSEPRADRVGIARAVFGRLKEYARAKGLPCRRCRDRCRGRRKEVGS